MKALAYGNLWEKGAGRRVLWIVSSEKSISGLTWMGPWVVFPRNTGHKLIHGPQATPPSLPTNQLSLDRVLNHHFVATNSYALDNRDIPETSRIKWRCKLLSAQPA